MAFSIYLPGQNGQGVNLQFGDANGDGRFDWGVGVRNSDYYGNGYSGVYNSNEIGFNSGRGVYLDGANGAYTPFQQQHNYWGVDSSGVSRGSSTYADVFGNYNNSRYANDVWGNYHQGQTQSNGWGWSNQDLSGNVWSGNQSFGAQFGNVFGQTGSYGYQRFGCGGGFSTGGWFGF